MGKKQFEAVVGNPPYQIGPGRNSQVYGAFYLTSRIYSRLLSLIFPSGWQSSSPQSPNAEAYETMKRDSFITLLENYPENQEFAVFPGIATGGVNVILRTPLQRSKESVPLRDFLTGASEIIFSELNRPRGRSAEIFEKLAAWAEAGGVPSMRTLVTSRGFGINTFVTNDPEREDYSFVSLEKSRGSIPLWSRAQGSNRYGWHYLDPAYPKLKLAEIEKHKLIWVKMGAASNWRRTKVLKPGEIHSDTFIGIRLDSEKELANFQSYFSTLFYRFCLIDTVTTWSAMPIAHRYVPALESVTNPRTGEIGWESDWNDNDLEQLFAEILSKEDWEYMRMKAIESDPEKTK